MKASKLFGFLIIAAFTCACVIGLSACSSESDSDDTAVEGLTGGVAATVNGVEIEEDTITTYIQNYRTYYGVTDDESWAEHLNMYGMDPAEYRESIIDSYIRVELIKQACEEKGIEADSEEIDSEVAEIRANYETDEEWQVGLQSAGFEDETAYRENLEENIKARNLEEEVTGDQTPTDEEILEYAKENMETYNGAKKSSHILFNTEDEATAQEVLAKLQAGELDFAAAAQEYSKDTASAADGGNVGWDKLTSFVAEYTEALATLNVGEMSGLVSSEYGFHIILVTEVFTAPEELTEISQLPEEFVESFRESLLSTKESEAYSTWYDEYKEAADIVINDMPENVPYNVDMSAYETEEDDTATDSDSETDVAGEEVTAESTDEEVSAESTDSENPENAEASPTEETATSEQTLAVYTPKAVYFSNFEFLL